MRSDLFLPIYAGVMVAVLIAVMLIVDKDTPKTIYGVLVLAYGGFITFYFWNRQGHPKSVKIRSLHEFQQK